MCVYVRVCVCARVRVRARAWARLAVCECVSARADFASLRIYHVRYHITSLPADIVAQTFRGETPRSVSACVHTVCA